MVKKVELDVTRLSPVAGLCVSGGCQYLHRLHRVGLTFVCHHGAHVFYSFRPNPEYRVVQEISAAVLEELRFVRVDDDYHDMTRSFSAFANPHRIRIVKMLASLGGTTERAVLCRACDMAAATFDRHVAKLLGCGILEAVDEEHLRLRAPVDSVAHAIYNLIAA